MNQFSVNLIGVVSTPSEIDELIENNERARLYLLSEAADHACSDDMPHAEQLQSREIGLVRNFVRRDRMFFAVSRQKSDTPAAKFAYDYRSGRLPVGSFLLDGIGNYESWQFTETRSADNSNKQILSGGELLLVLSARESR
jgi:hypothetical protein